MHTNKSYSVVESLISWYALHVYKYENQENCDHRSSLGQVGSTENQRQRIRKFKPCNRKSLVKVKTRV